MQISQDLRLAAAKSQDESGNFSQGSSLENRYPGAKSSAEPKDLLDRTGGMPMDGPPVQDVLGKLMNLKLPYMALR